MYLPIDDSFLSAVMEKFLKDCFSPLVEWKEEGVLKFTTSAGFRESSTVTQCSRFTPVTAENCGKLVLNRSKLKKHCRNGVNPNARKRLWLDVVEVTDADSVLLVKAFGEPQEGKWEFNRQSSYGWGGGCFGGRARD